MQIIIFLLITILILGGVATGIMIGHLYAINSSLAQVKVSLTRLGRTQDAQGAFLKEVNIVKNDSKVAKIAESRVRAVNQIVSQMKGKIEEDIE